MKISKLFHWLYAFIMLMPVFFIGGRVLYTVFNKNAKDSYSGITIQEEDIEYTHVNSLEVGKRYYFNPTLDMVFNSSGSQKIFEVWYDNIEVQYNYASNIPVNNSSKMNIYINNGSNQLICYFYDSNGTNIGSLQFYNQYTTNFYFNFINSNNDQNFDYVKQAFYFPPTFTESASNSKLDNAFSYSVSQLNENALFSWAKDSFLVTPFAYITGLFGLEATSPINTLLSYWLSISIIWLVFDLVMYLPLLFHRWLDKGVLE